MTRTIEKADYNTLIYSFEAFERIIEEIDNELSPAFEADNTQTAGSGVTNPTSAPAAASTVTTSTPTGTSAAATGQNANGTKPTEINAKAAVTKSVNDADPTKEKKKETPGEKEEKKTKIIEAIKKFIRIIGEILDKFQRWFMNRLRAFSGLDRAFFQAYNRQKGLVKPLNQIEVISYSYFNERLETIIKGFVADVRNCLKALSFVNESSVNPNPRVSEIINAEQGQMIPTLLKPYIKNYQYEVTNATSFIKYLVTYYRGSKEKRTYHQTDIPAIERNAISNTAIRQACTGYLNSARGDYNTLKALESKIPAGTDDKTVKFIKENLRKASVIFNTFCAVIKGYYELRVEQSMNYRIILKKFYQMDNAI